MVTFREASPDDEAAHVLLDQYFETRAATFPRSDDAAEGYRRPAVDAWQFASPRGVFLIVEGENLAGEPADVGCGGVRRIDDGPLGTRFEVKHVWVQPHMRGRGAGRRLMLELETRAVALGAGELVLDTHSAQTAAGALYVHLGYTAIEPFNDNTNADTWLGKSVTRD